MELDQLISYLINKEDSEGVVLLGHSTGCQVKICCFSFFISFKQLASIPTQLVSDGRSGPGAIARAFA